MIISHIVILWELMLINMAVNILLDIIIKAKAIPQGIVLLFATPLAPGKVKTKSKEGLHLRQQLTPLRKVSLLVLVILYFAISKFPKEILTQRGTVC